MRIGLFSDTYPPEINGVANSTYILRRALEKLGHQVYVITTNSEGGVDSHWEDGGKVLRFKGAELKFLYGYVAAQPIHMKALQEIGSLKLDVIHCQTEFGVGMFAHMCAAEFDLPIVCTYHTTYEDYTHYVNFLKSKTVDTAAKKLIARLSRDYGNRCTAVIAPSEKTRSMLEGYHIRRDISVIPTGLELSQFDPKAENKEKTQEIRRRYGLKADDFVLISVGRLAEEKSVDVVLGWMAEAVKENIPAKLMLVGSGPQEEEIRKLSRRMHLNDTVVFTGPVPKEEIPDYYRACDGFVSASLSETQGMTFIESLASGLPLFVRYDEVLSSLVIDGQTGWFIDSGEAFCRHLRERMAMDEEQKASMQKACLRQVEPYSAETFARKVLKVYEDAIQQYFDTWIIDDIQVKDSFIQLYLVADNDEEERLLVTLDDYAELGLRKGGKLTRELFSRLKEKENGVKAYQGCLVRISIKDRTRKEIYDWLTKETECDITTINKIVDKLEAKGYIDDERYCTEAIASLKASFNGPDRIIRQLMRKGIPAEMVQAKLDEQPDTSLEEAEAYAAKQMNAMKSDSVRKQKYTIENKLVGRGYSRETAKQAVESLPMAKAESRELDNLKKCAAKARKRYARKYKDTELRNHVFRYCQSQGYDIEDIYAVIDEMEWDV